MLSGLDKVLIGLLTLILMVGMGTTLTRADYVRVLKSPKGVLIGLALQFGWIRRSQSRGSQSCSSRPPMQADP